MGLDWDEGPEVEGPHGPYFQSEKRPRYQEVAQELLAQGVAALVSEGLVRLGQLAVRSFEAYAPDASVFAGALDLPEGIAQTIHTRVAEKLAREAVEDFRIDFEDGYGTRPDAEEDARGKVKGVRLADIHEVPPYPIVRVRRGVRSCKRYRPWLGCVKK